MTRRISCGVATGADAVFVVDRVSVPDGLSRFAFPTIAGRHLQEGVEEVPAKALLAPYDLEGELLPETELGPLADFLGRPDNRVRLESRTCVSRKPWYAFHDSFPIQDMMQPKLLCKDIASEPFFVVDQGGEFVPRHSVYYIVPNAPEDLATLAQYLNSEPARAFLKSHSQRAANGFFRLQSRVLKQVPIPDSLELVGEASGQLGLDGALVEAG
ncbi:MAG: TaqI-like C-terminal specificity domain-containing protein [Gemmatimonadales bacterium]